MLRHLTPFVVGRQPPSISYRLTSSLRRFPRIQTAIFDAVRLRVAVTVGRRRVDVQIGRHPLFAVRHPFGRSDRAGQVLVFRCTLRRARSEEHTSELQSQSNLVCRLLLEKKKLNNLELPTE